ncbi:hypothetical protein C8J57DRAFT_1250022 [Mycena rebaudengoi]|nr:hypothetical protein C8J57DRAFT_1250022 [Mycena rebaudengoi]
MSEIVPMFSGEPASAGSEAVTPSTFIKWFRAHMRDLGGINAQTNAEKIDAFLDYLVEDSPAEKWFKAHQAGATAATTWQALEAAFHVRFPGPVKAERSAQEWERELVGMKLTLEELNTTVKIGGVDVFEHVHYAGRLLEVARLAGIDQTPSGIWQSCDALPELLHEKVSSTHTNWAAYVAEIKVIDRVHIREGVAKAMRTREMEHTVADLKAHATPSTPVSKIASQFARAALATPQASTAPVQGNLFKAPEMTDEGREHLHKIVEGRCYRTTHQGARSTQGESRGGSEYTAAPGCFSSAPVTTPFHRGANCPGPEVPVKVHIFRGLCAKFLKEMPVAINTVLDELDWMDFLQDEGPADFGAGLSNIQDDANVLHNEQCDVTNLYTVGTGEEKHCKPFKRWIIIEGPQGEKVWVKALWDGGALTGTVDIMATVVEEVMEELACTTQIKEVVERRERHGIEIEEVDDVEEPASLLREEVYMQPRELHTRTNSLGACATPKRAHKAHGGQTK